MEFECCRNTTIFPHLNPMDVQREFLVEFKFKLNCFQCLAYGKAQNGEQ